MTFGLCYWIGMFIWLVAGITLGPKPWGRAAVPDLLLFILLVLVGWKVFGPPIHN